MTISISGYTAVEFPCEEVVGWWGFESWTSGHRQSGCVWNPVNSGIKSTLKWCRISFCFMSFFCFCTSHWLSNRLSTCIASKPLDHRICWTENFETRPTLSGVELQGSFHQLFAIHTEVFMITWIKVAPESVTYWMLFWFFWVQSFAKFVPAAWSRKVCSMTWSMLMFWVHRLKGIFPEERVFGASFGNTQGF